MAQKNKTALMKLGALVTATSMSSVSMAAGVDWAHQNGSLQSNGSITVKTISGGSYVSTRNPSGANVKTNQNAATQPATIKMEVSAVNRWSMYYKDRVSGLP